MRAARGTVCQPPLPATKLRDGGARRRNASARTSPVAPTATSAQRQSAAAATRLAISRPPMPPKALPAM